MPTPPPEHEQEEEIEKQDPLAGDPIPFDQFLQEYPVSTPQKVSGYSEATKDNYRTFRKLAPPLRLWCRHEKCEGFRMFEGRWGSVTDVGSKKPSRDFLTYRCRNCSETEKTFSLLSVHIITASPEEDYSMGLVLKVGEHPELHIDLPSSLPSLLGTDYPVFIKGLKCEKQGFGIGAFSYYRRIVETQKHRVFEQIAKVAERVNAPKEAIDALRKAAKESQFTKAIEMAKDFIPPSLLSNGHNPMKLLHRALSSGIHCSDDSDCLRLAHSIRIVLQELATSIKQTLRDERELQTAISVLLQFKNDA
jgi:hypothetical protein